MDWPREDECSDSGTIRRCGLRPAPALHLWLATRGEVEAWIEESVALCRDRLAFLFDLTANERAFLDGVLDRGEIDAGQLDIVSEIRTRTGAMPTLAWKTRHVREHRGLEASKVDH